MSLSLIRFRSATVTHWRIVFIFGKNLVANPSGKISDYRNTAQQMEKKRWCSDVDFFSNCPVLRRDVVQSCQVNSRQTTHTHFREAKGGIGLC